MKKVMVCIILSILLVFTSFSVGATSTDSLMDECIELGWCSINDSDDAKQKALLAYMSYLDYKDYIYENKNTQTRIMPVTTTYEIYVENFEQERTNWCGPACIKQSLSFHKNYSNSSVALPSQATLAQRLGIYSNSNGSSSELIATVLNEYKNSFGNFSRYIAADISDKSNPMDFLFSCLRLGIEYQNNAPIILIQTGPANGIPEYHNAGVSIRHYNTISAVYITRDINYNDAILDRGVTRVDPHYEDRFRGYFTNSLTGVYSSVQLADANGSNKVLIY